MSRTLPILSLAVLAGVPVWMAGTAARGEAVGPEPLPSEGPKPPWACRLDKTGRAHAGHGLGLVDLPLWDPEPDAPAPVKEEQFAPALNQLCSSDLSYQQSNQYAHWILEACQRFGVDPFLLASLVFAQGSCQGRSFVQVTVENAYPYPAARSLAVASSSTRSNSSRSMMQPDCIFQPYPPFT